MANNAKKILLIDDELDIIRTTGIALSAQGFKVTTASSAETALERLEEEIPDLIVLDLMLPAMSGYEFALLIKQKGISIPVILITAFVHKNYERELEDSRAIDFCFKKPFELDKLINKIRELIN